MWRFVASAALFAVLAQCAGPVSNIPGVAKDELAAERRQQLVFQLRTRLQQTAHLHAVAYRVFTANAADCKSIAPKLGFSAAAPKELPEAYRRIAVKAFGFDRARPTVFGVADNGPAAQAGLRQGDVLATIEGEAIPQDKPSAWVEQRLKAHGDGTVQIGILRDGAAMTLAMSPVRGCATPIALATSSEVNAFTDGSRIVVQRGILRLAQNDAELAMVVGHELAHVNLGHLQKRLPNQLVGNVGGLLVDAGLAAVGVNTGGAFMRDVGKIAARAYVVDFEKEADYVGTYYAARAGYNVGTVERFWRALAQEDPAQVSYAGLHPTTPERFLLMQKTRDEILDKQRRNVALAPELKAFEAAAPADASATN